MVEASKERGLLFTPLLVGSRKGVSSLEPHMGPRWTVHRTSAPVGDGGIARVSREQVSDVGSLCMWNLGFGERITGKSWVRE